MRIDINTDAAVIFANKLEKINRSALPVAVRRTLNSAAFDVKQNTMLKSSSNTFTQRKKNFFKATSRVQQSKGFDINTMHSIVGFVGGEKNQAIRDLEQQEKGGDIGNRKFIPVDAARIGRNKRRSVSNKHRLKTMPKKIASVREFSGKSWGARYLKAAHSTGIGGLVINTSGRYGGILKITSLRRGYAGYKKIYTLNKREVVSVKKTGFMRVSSLESAKKLEGYFVIEAKKRIERELR